MAAGRRSRYDWVRSVCVVDSVSHCVCGLWSLVGLFCGRAAGLFCDLGIKFNCLSFQFFI